MKWTKEQSMQVCQKVNEFVQKNKLATLCANELVYLFNKAAKDLQMPPRGKMSAFQINTLFERVNVVSPYKKHQKSSRQIIWQASGDRLIIS